MSPPRWVTISGEAPPGVFPATECPPLGGHSILQWNYEPVTDLSKVLPKTFTYGRPSPLPPGESETGSSKITITGGCSASSATAAVRPVSDVVNLAGARVGSVGRVELDSGEKCGDYVALGDSYASGEGLPPLGECHRSPHAYPPLVQNVLRFGAFHFDACTGATTSDLLHQAIRAAKQKELSEVTGLVTVTIGGDDIGFSKLITQCLLARIQRLIRFAEGCFQGKFGIQNGALVARGLARIRKNLPGTLRLIQDNAPHAQVMVLGYPYVFPRYSSLDCSKIHVFGVSLFDHPAFTADDIPSLWHIIVQLNATLQWVVGKVNRPSVEYVPTTAPFMGPPPHDACEPNHSWFTDIYIGGSQQTWSLHPTEDGQHALANVVIHKFIG